MSGNNRIYIYPTDTVWGIGGNIHSYEVYKKVAETKKHDLTKPVSSLFNSYEMLLKYFNLPMNMQKKRDELIDFFQQKITLGVPISWMKNNSIPKWIYQDSNVVTIRLITQNVSINKIIALENAPIITTSLNRSGEDPIIFREDAFKFFQKYISDATFVCEPPYIEKEGAVSSNILFLDEKFQFKFIRKGEEWIKIEKYMELFSTKLL